LLRSYRDKEVVGVFVPCRFRAPLQSLVYYFFSTAIAILIRSDEAY
jgi:hypothetical protein